MRSILTISTILLLLTSCAEKSDKQDLSGSGDPAPVKVSDDTPPVETVVTGTLSLDPEISAESADGLIPGGAIPEATVFLKGLPDQVATTDEDGNFTLAIDPAMVANLTTDEKTILMWKTTEKRRFGTKEKFTNNPGDEVKLGNVALTYTMAIHISLLDESTSEPISSECEIEIEGFKGRLEAAKISAGKYDTTYMPADDYTYIFRCNNYAPKTETITVEAAVKVAQWMTWNVSLTPGDFTISD